MVATTLMVFEMTGDYTLTLAVMIAVVISSVIALQSYGKTVFSCQLENRGLNLREGMETETGELAGTVTLAGMNEVAFDHGVDDLICAGDVADLPPPILAGTDDLDAALKLMRDTGEGHVAVVEDLEAMKFIGCVHERDVMSADNTVLLENRREERDN